jgi:hypothetical protein
MTKDKSFEEQFPELKDKVCVCINCDEGTTKHIPPIALFTQDMAKHCLSKQRVKEAIEKARKCFQGDGNEAFDGIDAVEDELKEMGL